MIRPYDVLGLNGLVAAALLAGCGGEEQAPAATPKPAARHIALTPTAAAPRGASGVATVRGSGGRLDIAVTVKGLDPSERDEAYEVWLYNSRRDALSVGAQQADSRGKFRGRARKLPPRYRLDSYRYIDVSLERIDRNRRHSGRSVLRGLP